MKISKNGEECDGFYLVSPAREAAAAAAAVAVEPSLRQRTDSNRGPGIGGRRGGWREGATTTSLPGGHPRTERLLELEAGAELGAVAVRTLERGADGCRELARGGTARLAAVDAERTLRLLKRTWGGRTSGPPAERQGPSSSTRSIHATHTTAMLPCRHLHGQKYTEYTPSDVGVGVDEDGVERITFPFPIMEGEGGGSGAGELGGRQSPVVQGGGLKHSTKYGAGNSLSRDVARSTHKQQTSGDDCPDLRRQFLFISLLARECFPIYLFIELESSAVLMAIFDPDLCRKNSEYKYKRQRRSSVVGSGGASEMTNVA
ncbi:hypothetical protein GEV33_008529 [Tenebrio molitor]|uniref:Uncharacterized protein n=1 Tax=Tenebrio molitor TaxID=7067 RepID=A0A8J6HHC9_TENMO|nr:hypothetical protein GEV33_008529 [Tenebrio molitor]